MMESSSPLPFLENNSDRQSSTLLVNNNIALQTDGSTFVHSPEPATSPQNSLETNFHGLFMTSAVVEDQSFNKQLSIRVNSNSQFFERQHQYSQGAASLVAEAMYETRDLSSRIHPSSTIWALLMTWLLSGLPQRKRDAIDALLRYATSFKIPPPFLPLIIQNSSRNINAMYSSGSQAISQILPYPMIQQVADGHIYVSVVEIIRDLVGHGRHIESFSADTSSVLAKSQRGQDIIIASQKSSRMVGLDCNRKFPGHVLPIYIWRDGFDPFNVKKNKASAWCMFVSIATPCTSIHSSCNTYLAALGPSKSSHDVVEKLLLEDLQKLSTGNLEMYDGKAHKVVPIYAQIYSIQEDRPEKSSHTYTSAGNSLHHARFGYAGNIQAVRHELPSCTPCYQLRLLKTRSAREEPCTLCYDWNFDNIQYPVPKDYPTSHRQPPTNQMLPFKKISFESLYEAFRTSHNCITEGNWSVAQARCYLATEGIGSNLVDQLVKNAITCKKFFKQRDQAFSRLAKMKQPLSTKNAAFRDTITQKFSAEECAKQQMLSPPSSWQYPNTSICEWVETIMHQVFLGVTKSIFQDQINVWLRSNRKFTSFVSQVNPKLLAIKSMTLDFCKAESITTTGKFGKYVSENYLAYARLCKWLHGNLDKMQQVDRLYCDPEDKQVSEYTAKEAREWLCARNISCPTGITRESLITLIQQIISQQPSGQPPPMYRSNNLNTPVSVIEQLIASFLCMVSRIMLSGLISPEEVFDVDRHIKLFLSNFKSFDEYQQGPQAAISQGNCSSEWLTKYNFITLLNVPDCMGKFGSLRNLFEGDGKGEGALPILKEVITSVRGNWAYNVAKKYYQKRATKEVLATALVDQSHMCGELPDEVRRLVKVAASVLQIESMEDNERNVLNTEGRGQALELNVQDSGSTSDARKNRRYKNYQSYKDRQEVHRKLLKSVPVSVVVHRSGYCAMLSGKKMVALSCGVCQATVCAAAYFDWLLQDDPEDIPCKFFLEEVVAYGILLPLSQDNGTNFPCYYLITSEWKEMLPSGMIGRPQLPGAVY